MSLKTNAEGKVVSSPAVQETIIAESKEELVANLTAKVAASQLRLDNDKAELTEAKAL